METTSAGGPHGIGDLAFREDFRRTSRRIRDRDGLQKGACVRVFRIGINRPGRTHLDNPTEIHDSDTVAHELRSRQIVRDEQVC